MPEQQFTRSSIADHNSGGIASGWVDHVPDEPCSLPASIAVIAGLSGVLWGVVWHVGRGIIGF